MYQYRPAGSTIIKGTTLKIKVAKRVSEQELPPEIAP